MCAVGQGCGVQGAVHKDHPGLAAHGFWLAHSGSTHSTLPCALRISGPSICQRWAWFAVLAAKAHSELFLVPPAAVSVVFLLLVVGQVAPRILHMAVSLLTAWNADKALIVGLEALATQPQLMHHAWCQVCEGGGAA
jgi:hypothetical protein